MATRTEPTVGETSGALFRALRSVGVEADLAYLADDEVRSQAGQNVIAVLGAKIDTRSAELNAKIEGMQGQIDSLHTELSTKIDAQGTRIDAVNSRIDTLQRVIWPLVGLLATTVFGLLYRVITAPAP